MVILLYLIWPGSASTILCSPTMIERSESALLLLLVELAKFSWLLELSLALVTTLLLLVFMVTSLTTLVMVLVILVRQEEEVIACLEVMIAAVHRKELPGESTVGPDKLDIETIQ